MSGKMTKEDLIKPLRHSEVKAKDIVRALTLEDNGLVHLVLRHKKIIGKLDLKNRLITIPVTFRNCEFLGDVDLRNCEFEQVVDLTRCTFHRGFNSGDDTESHSVYKKDLICNEAIFKGDVSFVGSSIESSAYFSKAVFQGRDKPINFQGTSFGKFLRCDGATFESSVDFRGLKCDKVAFFNPAKVKADGEQNNTRPVTFEKAVRFRFASFGINLECDRATFKDRADFAFLNCRNNATFTRCNFEGEAANFYRASFGGDLDCTGVTFKSSANFGGLRCGASGIFVPAEPEDGDGGDEEGGSSRAVCFEKAADFRYASFGINLACDRATFKDRADFSYLKCDEHGYFYLANFEGEKQAANFVGATFGGNLDCTGVTFKSSANFGRLRCGASGVFVPAEPEDGDGGDEEGGSSRAVCFEKAADFRYASFGTNLACDRATFKGSASFYSLKCQQLRCQGTGFQEGASFEAVQCQDLGFLGNAEFGGEARFYVASFGKIDCIGAKFKEKANFQGLKSEGYMLLDNAEFGGEVDFRYASLESSLQCPGAKFRGAANFYSLKCQELRCQGTEFQEGASFEAVQCQGTGFLGNAEFGGKVDFRNALFDGDWQCIGSKFKEVANFYSLKCQQLRCQGTEFQEGASFEAVQCQGTGFLDDAEFGGKVNFYAASFSGDLKLIGAHFSEEANLGATSISQTLDLSESQFQKQVSFRDARIGMLALGRSTFPFEPQSLDLGGLTFTRLHNTEKTVAKCFAKEQDPNVYSRDPYVQLERYYINSGDEVEAKRIHYIGRRELRENAKKRDGTIKWPRRTRWGDWWIKWLTGYGVQTWRLLIPICFFVIIGAAVFWPDSSVESTAVTQPDTFLVAEISETAPPQSPASNEQSLKDWVRPFEPIGYSIDLFLPVVNLHIDENWTPTPLWREVYAFVHSMAGWLLVPLLITSLAGIVRRQ
jgi:hypothetical protein